MGLGCVNCGGSDLGSEPLGSDPFFVCGRKWLDVAGDELSLPLDQHDQYLCLSEKELLVRDDVYLHSKWYFMDGVGVR